VDDYLPVMLSVDHPYPEIEAWIAERFEALNNKKVLVVHAEDLPEEALFGQPTYAKAWLWDVVPKYVQRMLYFDYDIVPLRALPDIPDVPFAAVPDAQWYVDKLRAMYPFFEKTRHAFNGGFFMARRDTRPCFDQLKSFALRTGCDNPYAHVRGADEQTPMNHLLQSTFAVHWLPREFHCLVHTDYEESAGAYMLHFPGTPSKARWSTMSLLRSILGTRPILDE